MDDFTDSIQWQARHQMAVHADDVASHAQRVGDGFFDGIDGAAKQRVDVLVGQDVHVQDALRREQTKSLRSGGL